MDKGLPPIPASQLSSPVSPAAYDQQAAWPLPTTQTPVKTSNSLQMPAPYTPSSSPEVQMPTPQTEDLPPAPVPMPIPQVNGFAPSNVDPTTECQNQGEAQSYYAIETSLSVGGSAVDGLAEIAGKLNDDDDVAQRSRTEKAMGMLEDKADAVNGQVSLVSQVVQPIQALIEATGAVEAIKNGLNSFMEDIPWLMKSLDEVAKIHPVVTAAVLAFKAVYTMEMTRRENDRRIISLHVSMKDMIQILVQLRDIKDPKDVGPDGRTLEARLQSLSDNAAADIKACANACETYIKKRLLVKVLKGKVWESKLIDFIGTFTKRRAEFEFALAIHTAKAVESMKRTVESIDEKVAALTALLRDQFCHFTPENEIELARKVEEKGGVQAVKNNDFLLRELDDFQGGADSGMKKGASSKTGGGSANHATKTESVNERSAQRSTFTLQDLKDELHEDWDTALKENLKTFEGKFALQQRHLEQALSKFIHEENNRLIDEVNKGPHDKIKNEELKMIWKEMVRNN
ncbi:hypothetical protein EW026_g779 [Hermanssonia centrifuga]|uniref:Fungal STAND N-terminal Goodbye domain-containing protein n=1 Tax=Hermanssonia centrifuga TaxID=98765 RepID=A0A4S4KU53_9APHY|nr:hypothetical protein EW026_g779 [Hermanssonia centrifuga]